ncbi:Transporter [Thermus sp. CCB_US3_UF1]|uniref:TRAP transporter permease n=1 Tax=unclassified Thermus TaxID=2619321 RepID=UPI000238A3C3|nr:MULTISPECIES: TRAP transporter fused permease subunit [unclassified Thermus]AEV15734.1 Transporter [Thermus sp. CCB_US3_UF1]MDW8017007.1 TRAP transporter fused permease subunit [Thermus sp.]MDW8358446.1 TRAP transporter fused permease subunit [Thermus sp.]
MELEHPSTPQTPLARLAQGILILGALYSLYLVLHPFTPLARAEIPILDIVQLQRSTHVLFLLLGGYLVSFYLPRKRTLGAWVYFLFTLVPLYNFLFPGVPGVSLPWEAKAVGLLYWAVAALPALLPGLKRPADLLAVLLALFPTLYQLRYFEELVYRAVLPQPWDMAMSFGLIMLVLGLVYRLLGPVMPVLVLFFFSYNLYADLFPGAFRGSRQGIDLLLGKTFNETEAGIYGLITGVSAKYLVYFTLLSGMIGALGLGKVVANLALALVGKHPATPGRVTGLASVFMGMFSGSGAADTQFVAALTKPLFEKARYHQLTAAGLVATAGTIALITPPVMGSIAFIMVEILQIPYLKVIIMALGPALLYLTAVLAFNEFYSRKAGLPPVGAELGMGRRAYALRYSTLFLPILLIIVMLYLGYEVRTAASLALVLFVLIAYLDPTLRPKGVAPILQGLAEGFRTLLPIGTAVTAANLIFAMMVISGLPSKFSQLLQQVSGESLFLATLITAVFSLVLGMGVPPTATYVLTSALTAPAIIALAKQNGIPDSAALLATHMFLFYYAVLADVTPPVALSAYAASSVFGTNPLQTGVYAARVALSKYLVGFFFLLSYSGTALLIVPVLENSPPGEAWPMILERFFSVAAGIIYLSASGAGYTRRPLKRWEAWALGTLAVLLFVPHGPLNLAAFLLGLPFFSRGKGLTRAGRGA